MAGLSILAPRGHIAELLEAVRQTARKIDKTTMRKPPPTRRIRGTLVHELYGAAQREVLTQIDAGATHACGLNVDHEIVCWGEGDPAKLAPGSGPFVQVTAGGSHTCGLRGDGTAECWPPLVNAPGPELRFRAISAGHLHACAVQDGDVPEETIYCWGDVTRPCGGHLGGCAGDACSADRGCRSNVCTGGRCQVPGCSDGVQNGFESGVDCGAGCITPCPG